MMYTEKDIATVLYEFWGGELDGVQTSREFAESIAEGHTEDLSRVRDMGGLCQRKELDNQPTIRGYLGPMWDGIRHRVKSGKVYYDFEPFDASDVVETYGVIRYETQEIYDILSK